MIYIFLSGNSNSDISKSDDRIDSILRVLTIPERQGQFVNRSPEPIIIVVPQANSTNNGFSNELLREFQLMKDDNARTRAYAEAIALKVYQNKYQDSTVAITVIDSIEGGKLTNQDVSWTIKPREIEYHENIYYMKPKFIISAGMQLQNTIDSVGVSRMGLYPNLGYKGKKGWTFEAGINVLNTKEFMVGVKKDIFTKYNKIPDKE